MSTPQLPRSQRDFATREQARAAGLSNAAVDARIARGSWRRVLPRVLLTEPRRLDDDDRAVAALLYVGPSSAVTAHGAAARRGVRHVPRSDVVTVLVPAGATVRSRDWVRVVETTRPVTYVVTTAGVRIVPVARAVADTALMTGSLGTVRAFVADAVQRGRCDVTALRHELDAGPRRGSAHLRAVLDEVAEGARSAPEARLLTAVHAAGLPPPRCNEPLVVGGQVVAVPDLWWPDARLIVEVDSREWHLSPRDWERTMRRHNRLQALGYVVLHFPPSRITRDLDTVVAEITAAHAYLTAMAR